MRRIIVFCLALILFATPKSMFAQQDSKPTENRIHYYQLSFSVQDVGDDGKVSNNRAYKTSIATGSPEKQMIRTGDKMPIRTDNTGNAFQYVDIGVSIDCANAQEVNGKLAVQVNAEISGATKGTDLPAPLIRQNRWQANVLVPVAKPTVIFSSDHLQDKGKVQVELTATRID